MPHIHAGSATRNPAYGRDETPGPLTRNPAYGRDENAGSAYAEPGLRP
jgi:hypothetical protein